MVLRGTRKPAYLCTNPTLVDADDVTEALGHAEKFLQVEEAEYQIERIGQLNWASIYDCRYMTVAEAKRTYGE
jgi:hypothetical protein